MLVVSGSTRPPTSASQPPKPERKTMTMMRPQPRPLAACSVRRLVLAHTRCHIASLKTVAVARERPKVKIEM